VGPGLKAILLASHPAWKPKFAQLITCGIPILVLELMGVSWWDLLEAAFEMTVEHGLSRISEAAQLPR
jgi:hypothetical protein